ncbi:helix-turn-helix domain-containing protein [Streptomyces rishiriensis]|uniref:helix-turn-helix domain-containing protein n=1 Tax=Streptomyces rishiriensis TaxID=68264 RepID=UPI003F4CF419
MSTDDCVSDVTEFASLLTELKGRTERSYGSLARRLGMNTSTLHRYCAGEAVPQDFAPVERLAEFCGATPEERIELHRRWLRAASARQRPRDTRATETQEQAETAATAGTPGTEKTGEAAESWVTPGKRESKQETRETQETSETTRSSEAPEVPRAPRAPGTPGALRSLRSLGAPGGARASGASEASTGAKVGAPAVAATQKPASTQIPPHRWYRRRTSVLVGAACALLTTLSTLSALPGGSHPSKSDDSARSAASPAVSFPTATPGRSAASAPKPTPASATPPSPSPSSSPSPSLGRTSPVAEAAPAGAGAPASPAMGEPLTLTVDSQVWAQGCGHDYVIGKPPAQVPPPPMAQDAGPWASAQGAVHGRETNVEIAVQGRGSAAVALTALRVRVVGRATPAPGTVYAMELGCGGSLSKRYFAVDLDQDSPRARSVAGADVDTPIPAVRLPYRVSSKSPEVLLVTARTENCDCSWYLELGWSSEGRSGTVRIDDHGRPFRTTSIKGLPRFWYGSDDGDRHWIPITD